MKAESGFTLIELSCVLAIISILAMIAYPLYTQHLFKARRSDAEIALLDLASGMERYYADHNSYLGATLENTETNKYSHNDFYQMSIAMSTDEDYQLTAVPKNAQLKDTLCGNLGLNQLGEKTISGKGTVSECW